MRTVLLDDEETEILLIALQNLSNVMIEVYANKDIPAEKVATSLKEIDKLKEKIQCP